MSSRDSNFYKELDRYKKKGGSCNCASLTIFFVIFIFLLEFFVFSFLKNIRFDPKQVDIRMPSGAATQVQPSVGADGSGSVYISQGILCSMLVEQKKNDMICSITEDGIEISGKIGYLLPSNSNVTVYPVVSSGKLDFEVKKMAIGKIGVSPSLSMGLGGLLSKILTQKIESGQKVEFEKAEVSEGLLTLIFRKI